MDKPRINTQLVYNTVASLMPIEGKDYKLDARLDKDNKSVLVITPLSPIGRMWVPFLEKALTEPLKNENTAIEVGGVVAQEVVTISSIRAKAEAEAAAALNAKIEAARAEQKAKTAEAERLRNEQVAKEGEGSNPSSAVRNAYREANDAAAKAFKFIKIQKKSEAVRKSIDDAALIAAKEDLKQGRNWSVDMDAALDSLFDRQDVTQKMQERERRVLEISSRLVEADDIKNMAVNAVKQYIMPKEAE